MFEWDTTWNCQSGRLINEEVDFPWEDDDFLISVTQTQDPGAGAAS